MFSPPNLLAFREQWKAARAGSLRGDFSAGLTVGVMLIPQGMAYALIAGMPPIYGLYASLVPLVVYAFLGTSRQLAVGPVAMVSLLVAAGVAPLAQGDPQRYVELALLLALLVGILQLSLGLLRFGFLTNFLSHPVLAGFTSAAALIIGASQLKHLLGVDLPGSNHIHEIVFALLREAANIHPLTVAVGVTSMAALVGLKRWRRTFPAPLAVVAFFTAAAWALGLDQRGLQVVGDIPGGLPAPSIPGLEWEALGSLFPLALAIAVVGFMESIAVAKVYSRKHSYPVDPNQELVALGAANVVGSFFRAFPTTGGFSRTAVNDQAGARSTFATLVSAGIIGLTLLFLTGLFTHLPNAVLAAIVLVAVSSLLDWKEAVHLWAVDRRDLSMMGVTFGATLLLGIEEGIVAGVLVSLAGLVYDTSRPHSAVLGRLPGTETYRNLLRHPQAEAPRGVVVFRLDAPVCFANAQFLRDRIQLLMDASPDARALVLDFHAVNGMDSTGLQQLEEIVGELRARSMEVHFAGVKGPVMDRLRKGSLATRLGPSCFHHEVAHAAAAATAAAAQFAAEAPAGDPGAEMHGAELLRDEGVGV